MILLVVRWFMYRGYLGFIDGLLIVKKRVLFGWGDCENGLVLV